MLQPKIRAVVQHYVAGQDTDLDAAVVPVWKGVSCPCIGFSRVTVRTKTGTTVRPFAASITGYSKDPIVGKPGARKKELLKRLKKTAGKIDLLVDEQDSEREIYQTLLEIKDVDEERLESFSKEFGLRLYYQVIKMQSVLHAYEQKRPRCSKKDLQDHLLGLQNDGVYGALFEKHYGDAPEVKRRLQAYFAEWWVSIAKEQSELDTHTTAAGNKLRQPDTPRCVIITSMQTLIRNRCKISDDAMLEGTAYLARIMCNAGSDESLIDELMEKPIEAYKEGLLFEELKSDRQSKIRPAFGAWEEATAAYIDSQTTVLKPAYLAIMVSQCAEDNALHALISWLKEADLAWSCLEDICVEWWATEFDNTLGLPKEKDLCPICSSVFEKRLKFAIQSVIDAKLE